MTLPTQSDLNTILNVRATLQVPGLSITWLASVETVEKLVELAVKDAAKIGEKTDEHPPGPV
jgi:hypothetical protein